MRAQPEAGVAAAGSALGPAWLVILGGVAAALHVGKLAPAMPALRHALGVTLVQSGFLLSLVQLAGMALGLAVGAASDALGLKRTMVAGLALLAAASVLGGLARTAETLLVLRGIEGVGLLLATMPAPGLIRRLVSPGRLDAAMGLWGAYMPLATAIALLLGPWVLGAAPWQAWWWMLGALATVAAACLARCLPPDVRQHRTAHGWLSRLGATLRDPGPWVVALAFACYSGQWLAVIGFLPSIYAALELPPAGLGPITALVAAVNIAGNVAAGRLQQRGVRPTVLLHVGFTAMAAGSAVAFFAWDGLPAVASASLRLVGVLAFSSVGGLIPGTLFSLAVRLAPGEHAVSTTVGWMQQWSAFGQFAGPPLVAWIASRTGGWHWSSAVTGALAITGLALASAAGQVLRRRAPTAP